MNEKVMCCSQKTGRIDENTQWSKSNELERRKWLISLFVWMRISLYFFSSNHHVMGWCESQIRNGSRRNKRFGGGRCVETEGPLPNYRYTQSARDDGDRSSRRTKVMSWTSKQQSERERENCAVFLLFIFFNPHDKREKERVMQFTACPLFSFGIHFFVCEFSRSQFP